MKKDLTDDLKHHIKNRILIAGVKSVAIYFLNLKRYLLI